MKVICTNNKSHETLPLTIGKIYNIIGKMTIPYSPSRYDDVSGPFIKIKCDNSEEKWFDQWRFRELTQQEKRELKLSEIGL
jgi:rRNA processing protein Gar1